MHSPSPSAGLSSAQPGKKLFLSFPPRRPARKCGNPAHLILWTGNTVTAEPPRTPHVQACARSGTLAGAQLDDGDGEEGPDAVCKKRDG